MARETEENHLSLNNFNILNIHEISDLHIMLHNIYYSDYA